LCSVPVWIAAPSAGMWLEVMPAVMRAMTSVLP
jgi:hypothetical protein